MVMTYYLVVTRQKSERKTVLCPFLGSVVTIYIFFCLFLEGQNFLYHNNDFGNLVFERSKFFIF